MTLAQQRVHRAMAEMVQRANEDDQPLTELLERIQGELSRAQNEMTELTQERDEWKRRALEAEASLPAFKAGKRNYLTTREVAEITGASIATVCRWCDAGDIEAALFDPKAQGSSGIRFWKIKPDQVFPKRYAR
jgi:hypothetical protein